MSYLPTDGHEGCIDRIMDLEARAERAERERDEARYVAAEMFEAWFAEQMSLDLDRDVLGPVMGRWLDMEAGVSGEEGE